MAKPVDLELKQAFADFQSKIVATSKKIHVIDTQIGVLKKVLHHVELTKQEISTLPPGTKTYESIGRMFLLTDLDKVKSNLQNNEAMITSRTKKLEESKQYLEKNLEESHENIRDMVQQRKTKS